MSVAIRIDDNLYNEAKNVAAAESRTVPLQIAYWAKIGKAAIDNPDLPVDLIKQILLADARKEEKTPFTFE